MLLYFYIIDHKESLSNLFEISLKKSVIILSILILVNLIQVFLTKIFIEFLIDDKAKFSEAFIFNNSSTLLNYLPFSFGTIFKAHILKKIKNVDYMGFISVSIFDLLLSFFFGSILSFLSLINLDLFTFNQNFIYTLFFGTISIITGLLIYLGRISYRFNEKKIIGKFFNYYLEIFDKFDNNSKMMIYPAILIFCRTILIAYIYYFCFQLKSIDINISAAIIVSTITSMLMIVNITPAALGIREGMIGFIAVVSGFGFNVGLVASALYRAYQIIVHLSFGLPSLFYMKYKRML